VLRVARSTCFDFAGNPRAGGLGLGYPSLDYLASKSACGWAMPRDDASGFAGKPAMSGFALASRNSLRA
jgi:hypothetical protein